MPPSNRPRALSSNRDPLVCPNGHAMDEGLFECPACGAHRPSAHNPQPSVREQSLRVHLTYDDGTEVTYDVAALYVDTPAVVNVEHSQLLITAASDTEAK